jgi:hypothetical protein
MKSAYLSVFAAFVTVGAWVGCASQGDSPTSLPGNAQNPSGTKGSDAGTSSPAPTGNENTSPPPADTSTSPAGDDASAAVPGDDASPGPNDSAACGPSTCTGCCNASGACAGGGDLTACGTAGAACQTCGLFQTCQSGTCGTSTATPPPAGDAGGDMCANLGCFDIFDCAIYHSAQFGPCGFTKCDGLICKP